MNLTSSYVKVAIPKSPKSWWRAPDKPPDLQVPEPLAFARARYIKIFKESKGYRPGSSIDPLLQRRLVRFVVKKSAEELNTLSDVIENEMFRIKAQEEAQNEKQRQEAFPEEEPENWSVFEHDTGGGRRVIRDTRGLG